MSFGGFGQVDTWGGFFYTDYPGAFQKDELGASARCLNLEGKKKRLLSHRVERTCLSF